MSSYYIVSQLNDQGQTWAVTLQNDKIVVQTFEKGLTQKWDVVFQQGKTKAGIAFVCTNLAISFDGENRALSTKPFSPNSTEDDSTIWIIDSNQANPWYLIENPTYTGGQIWDVAGGTAKVDQAIYTWNENGGANQRWRFEKAD